MNNLIGLLSKEKSIYVLAAIIYACENNGIISANADIYRKIINLYLKGLIKPDVKTPQNTMSSILTQFDIGKKYFYYDKLQKSLSLTDRTDTAILKMLAQQRLNKKTVKIKQDSDLLDNNQDNNDHIAQWENKYCDILSFIKEEIEPAISSNKYKYMAVYAPVKSGKKIIKQFTAIRGKSIGNRIYYVVSSLNRKDCFSQRKEYEKYGIPLLLCNGKKIINDHIADISKSLYEGKEVIVLHDESDYGTGSRQVISDLYTFFKSNNMVKFLGFSATNEELALSELADHTMIYVPPPNYRGAKWYINNSLVSDAEPFFDRTSKNYLTDSGNDIIDQFCKSTKQFLIVRLVDGFPDFIRNHDLLKSAINSTNHKISVIVSVDEKNPWDWGKYGDWKKFDGPNEKVLILICQTATRSVEFCKPFLKKLYALHDYRSSSCAYGTKIQAQLRVAFFHSDDEDNDIKPYIYGCVDSLMLASHLETCKDVSLRNEWYRSYNHKLGIRISNNSSRKEYKEIVFNYEPNENAIRNACMNRNIVSINGEYFPKFRSIEKSNVDDMAAAILNMHARSTNTEGGIVVYKIDAPNPAYLSSWNKLMNKYKVGQFVALIPHEIKMPGTTNKSLFNNLTN